MRIEHDSLGELAVPKDALYGIHTLRARENFPLESIKNDPELCKNFLLVKEAAAIANMKAGAWEDKRIPTAIISSCDYLYHNFSYYHQEFDLPALQGGAGTSTNMNINEIIANKALQELGLPLGDYQYISPNDDVNKPQSTNDTYPTAGHLTMIKFTRTVMDELSKVILTLQGLATKYQDVLKMGRTQLEDAVPTTFGRSFKAYASILSRDMDRLAAVCQELMTIPLGGTAIGTGVTGSRSYMDTVVDELATLTKLPLKQCDDLVDGIQNNDCYVSLSNAYRSLAVDLSKMSNDLRLLNSGPQDGLSEINLPKRQAGSSIMPGKVNPVIPEFCTQVAYQVMGHATTVAMAAEAGQLELNAFEPVAFYDLFEDARLLRKALHTLDKNCLQGITINIERCITMVEHSAETATVLSPVLGYERTTEIIKESLRTGKSIRTLVKDEISQEKLDELLSPASFFVK